MPTNRVFADLTLARRLERAEGRGCSGYVEAHALLEPACGATWIEVAGAMAMFDGTESPITQCFGLGVFDDVRDDHLERIEQFFRDRGAATFLEMSPHAGVPLAQRLVARGYRPVEFTSVMVRELGGPSTLRSGDGGKGINVRVVDEPELDRWADTAAAGWSEHKEYAAVIRGMMHISAHRADQINYLAEIGTPVAAGALVMHENVGLLAGASTIPRFRRRGAQDALLHARLAHAASNGCDIAMMCAEPGSASQRNAERNGFRIAYTRTKWGLDCGS